MKIVMILILASTLTSFSYAEKITSREEFEQKYSVKCNGFAGAFLKRKSLQFSECPTPQGGSYLIQETNYHAEERRPGELKYIYCKNGIEDRFCLIPGHSLFGYHCIH